MVSFEPPKRAGFGPSRQNRLKNISRSFWRALRGILNLYTTRPWFKEPPFY